jgi:hypothetical protein
MREMGRQKLKAFPHQWGVIDFLVKTFCSAMNLDLEEILSE